MSKRTRQINNRGDRKGKANDSPEIPDRGLTSDIPGLPFWYQVRRRVNSGEECWGRILSNRKKRTVRSGEEYCPVRERVL